MYQDQLCPNDVELVSIHTLMHVATIHLHRDLLMMYSASYQRCLTAANAVTSMIRELNDGDYSFLNPILSVRRSNPLRVGSPLTSAMQTCWKSAAQVYLQVLEMQQTRLLQSVLDAVNGQLDALVNALRLLGRVFPAAGECPGVIISRTLSHPAIILCVAHDAQKTEEERALRLSAIALFVAH